MLFDDLNLWQVTRLANFLLDFEGFETIVKVNLSFSTPLVVIEMLSCPDSDPFAVVPVQKH